MYSTSIKDHHPLSPLSHDQHPFYSNFARNQFSLPHFHYKKPKNSLHVIAKKRDAYDGKDHQRMNNNSRLVDDNMIVLRMRIKDMVLSEDKYEAPSNWMEWEKRWLERYDSDICEAMGMLQRFLMDARPSLVVGLFALLMLSVSTSSALLLGHLFNLFS